MNKYVVLKNGVIVSTHKTEAQAVSALKKVVKEYENRLENIVSNNSEQGQTMGAQVPNVEAVSQNHREEMDFSVEKREVEEIAWYDKKKKQVVRVI